MERQLLRNQEIENMMQSHNAPPIPHQPSVIQKMKERRKKEIMAQYFNYGFNEEGFKKYINQQV